MVATRAKLLDAARGLFAERGVEAVSLREIARAAEQGNVSALQYHFGNRERLLAAVLEPFGLVVDTRRAALLDELESRGEVGLRDLAGALVRPAASLLVDSAGREYLRIVGRLLARPYVEDFYEMLVPQMPSFPRWRRMVEPLMPEGAVLLHARNTAHQMAAIELRRRAEMSNCKDQRLFVSRLIDVVAGILAAPVSDETSRAMAERRRKRG